MSNLPKWLNPKETTRSRSKKQESKIAKDLKGYTTINSGATLGENDVVTDYLEVEAKTTKHETVGLKLADWEKLVGKAKLGKIPTMQLQFENKNPKRNKKLAVMDWEDFLYLVNKANK